MTGTVTDAMADGGVPFEGAVRVRRVVTTSNRVRLPHEVHRYRTAMSASYRRACVLT